MLSLLMLICDDTHHLNVISKTDPQPTNVVLAGDPVPVGTVLLTPALNRCLGILHLPHKHKVQVTVFD